MGHWDNIVEVKGIIILGFTKSAYSNIVLQAIHLKELVEITEIPLKKPIIEVGPGIIRPVNP
jgi:hypothetical protein